MSFRACLATVGVIHPAVQGTSMTVSSVQNVSAALLDNGVHVIPRGLCYVSTAHTDADLEETRAAMAAACASFAREAVAS